MTESPGPLGIMDLPARTVSELQIWINTTGRDPRIAKVTFLDGVNADLQLPVSERLALGWAQLKEGYPADHARYVRHRLEGDHATGPMPEIHVLNSPDFAPIPRTLFFEDPKTGEPKPDFPRFVEWFRNSERFVVPVERGTFSSPGQFELLRYEAGYYNGQARAFVRRRTEDAFREAKIASRDNFREEVVKGIGATSEFHRRRKDFNPPALLCLDNGILDILTGDVRGHSPDTVFTWKMPVAYDATATCPRFEQYLQEVMPDPKKAGVLVDLMGYCLWRANPFQHFFVLVGDGSNGKTTFGRVLGALLGKDAVSMLALQQIASNRFASAELEGRLVNVCDDLPYDKPLAATGIIKVLTGEGTLTVERKHQHPFEIEFGGKLVSMANRMPPTEDDTYAFWRRAVVIPFDQTFPTDDPRRDPLLFDKLREELPGILNLALKGLARVRSRVDSHLPFDPDGLFADGKEEWHRRADPVRAEIMGSFEADHNGFVPNSRLYDWHVTVSHGEGREPLNERAFGQALTRAFPLSHSERKTVAGRNVWGRPGIREKFPSPDVRPADIDVVVRPGQMRLLDPQNSSLGALEPATALSRLQNGPPSPELPEGVAAPIDSRSGELGTKVDPPARTGDETHSEAVSISTTSMWPEAVSGDSETAGRMEATEGEIEAAYADLLETVGRVGDLSFDPEVMLGEIMKRHSPGAASAAVGHLFGRGRVTKRDGAWYLKSGGSG